MTTSKLIFDHTVQRIKSDDTLYGPVHGSHDGGHNTVCGQDINHKFWILTDNYDGEVTCKLCLHLARKQGYIV